MSIADRLEQLANQLIAGDIKLSDVNIEKELAVIGLQTAVENQRYAERALASRETPTDRKIEGIAALLAKHRNFIEPVEKFVQALAVEELKVQEAENEQPGGD
jgi:hypothetical protein